jgi:hypothetical protein
LFAKDCVAILIYLLERNMSMRGGIVATPRLGMKRNSPTNATDFSLALQTLDEERMAQACSLLLSERDYQDDTVEGESDYSKLLVIYDKCRDAALVVDKRTSMMNAGMPSLTLLGPPPTSATMTPSDRAAANAARGLKAQGHLNSMSPPQRRMSLAQIARNGAAASGRVKVVGGPTRPIMKRETSDASLASLDSKSGRTSAKKARVQPGAPSEGKKAPSEGKKAAAPPPEALNFLQALNNQQKKRDRDAIPSPIEESRTNHARAVKTAKPQSTKPQGKRSSPRTKRG